MNRKLPLLIGIGVVGIATYAFLQNRGEKAPEIQYNYAAVQKGEIVRSISATGMLVALTSVDVKSKAGGIVQRLLVDESSVVKKGQLIAIIDPADTEAAYRQAKADVDSAQARADQARANYDLQVANSRTAVKEAEAALEAARIRLARAEVRTKTQPALSRSAVDTAEASLRAQQAELEKLEQVTIPQQRRDASSEVDRTRAALDAAEANLRRLQGLEQKGFVSGAEVEVAESNTAAARAAFSVAQQRLSTIERQIAADLRASRQAVEQAAARAREAKANLSQDQISDQDLAEARQAVRSAQITLQQARDAVKQNEIRRNEYIAAQASTVRSGVQLENAKVQLDSTEVLAPRDGVVTQKYLEEGTIIPPGTSTFAQGTSLVQISDVTQMFVECAVDEADVAAVQLGQKVRINTEAFPGQFFDGVVDRINPSAATTNNITAIKVRVRVVPGFKVAIKPGMNATCEFITLNKPNVLVVPAQALNREEGKVTVRVKTADPLKPEVREIKLGAEGNEGFEVLEGLKEGEEVVTAELDLAALRETQRRMQEAQEGGGLAGGGRPGGGRPAARPGGGGGAGGGRPGGGAR